MEVIKVKHTSIVIPNYKSRRDESVERYLSVWNDSTFSYDPIGWVYDEESDELRLPRGVDLGYLERKFGVVSEVDYKPDDYEKISIKLKVLPRNDVQKKSISFLIGENNFKYTAKYSQLLLNLQTGAGKTYAMIAALSLISMKTLIITHTDKIKHQWVDSLYSFTDIDEQYLCDISSSKLLEKLVKTSSLKYKIYIVNHGTIHSYAKKHGWNALSVAFNHLKIGVKIYDEAHLHFENIVNIDLSTNTKKTFYLTATFKRSNHNESRLFDICFKHIAMYGEEAKNESRKHMIYIAMLYNTHPSIDEEASVYSRFHGFNKMKYMDYQIIQPKFFDVLLYTVEYLLKAEGKLMVLSSKIETVEIIKDYLTEMMKDRNVSSFHSKIEKDVKERAFCADIISSTPQSAGTGADIPGLRFVIMTEAYSSLVQADQVSGRLREYDDTAYTFYVEMVDIGFGKAYDMYKKRLKIFKNKAFKIVTLDYDKRGR